MRKKRRARAFRPSHALAALLVCASPLLCGFNLIGNGKHVLEQAADGTVTFALGPDAPRISEKEAFEDGKYKDVPDETLWPQVVGIALAKWNAVPGVSVRLVAKPDSAAAVDQTDKTHAILLSSELPFSVAASALPTKDADKGFITDCDIQVGAGPTPLEDLVVTVAHELGHCLGLGHNHVDYGSLMGYSALDRSLELGTDDRAGLIFLYPASGSDTSSDSAFAPCGAIAVSLTPATPVSHAAWMLALPPFAAFCYSWRTRKRRSPRT